MAQIFKSIQEVIPQFERKNVETHIQNGEKERQEILQRFPISDWHSRFPDPTLADAILDRTVHNAYRLSLLGDSQRKIRGFCAISHT